MIQRRVASETSQTTTMLMMMRYRRKGEGKGVWWMAAVINPMRVEFRLLLEPRITLSYHMLPLSASPDPLGALLFPTSDDQLQCQCFFSFMLNEL